MAINKNMKHTVSVVTLLIVVLCVIKYLYNGKFIRTLPAFNGEFGHEIDRAIPYAYALYRKGQLRSIECMEGMEPFYKSIFAKHVVRVVPKRSRSIGLGKGWMRALGYYNHSSIRHAWTPPRYIGAFNIPFSYPITPFSDSSKPRFMIHNKYTTEWMGRPINFIPEPIVREMYAILKPHFCVVIIHPQSVTKGYTEDSQKFRGTFNYDGMLTIQDIMAVNDHLDYNTLQLALHDGCKHFISVQGGSSRIASLFGGVNVILHVKGAELKWGEYDKILSRLSDVDIRVIRNASDLPLLAKEFVNENLDLVPNHEEVG